MGPCREAKSVTRTSPNPAAAAQLTKDNSVSGVLQDTTAQHPTFPAIDALAPIMQHEMLLVNSVSARRSSTIQSISWQIPRYLGMKSLLFSC